MDIDVILNAREARSLLIKKLLDETNHTLVVVKANTPGVEKNTEDAKFIIASIAAFIKYKFEYVEETFYESEDGDFYIFAFDSDGLSVKRDMIKVENRHTLGRLVDLDVYNKQAISRTDLGFTKRKCMICDELAHSCVRQRNHSMTEINEYINEQIKLYKESIKTVKLITESLKEEVTLHPKFGLVTSHSSGIHQDMNVSHFRKSASVLEPYFLERAMVSRLTIDYEVLFKRLRKIGLNAENHMFDETAGVNTHKGAIFVFGLIIGALFMDNSETFRIRLSNLSKYSFEDFELNPETSGLKLYKKHQVLGVRGEMFHGLRSIFDHALPFYESLQLSQDQRLLATLMKLMTVVEDTVQIQKTSLEEFKLLQQEVKRILDLEHFYTDEGHIAYQKLFDETQLKKISPGGCADLLAATIFFLKIKKESFHSLNLSI